MPMLNRCPRCARMVPMSADGCYATHVFDIADKHVKICKGSFKEVVKCLSVVR